jgi:hypothetical protein
MIQKVYLKLLDGRNGFTTVKNDVLNLLVQLSRKRKMPTENDVAACWKNTMKISTTFSSSQLRKIMEFVNFLYENLPKKRKQSIEYTSRRQKPSKVHQIDDDDIDNDGCAEETSRSNHAYDDEDDDNDHDGGGGAEETSRSNHAYDDEDDDNDHDGGGGAEETSRSNYAYDDEDDDNDHDGGGGAEETSRSNHAYDDEDEDLNALQVMNRLISAIERSVLNEDKIVAIGAYIFDALESKLKSLKSPSILMDEVIKKRNKDRDDLNLAKLMQDNNLRDYLIREEQKKNKHSSRLFDPILSAVKLKVEEIVQKDKEASIETKRYPPQYDLRSNMYLPVQFSVDFQGVLSFDSLIKRFPEIEKFHWSDHSVVHIVFHYPQHEYWSYGAIVFKRRIIIFSETEECVIGNILAISELKRFAELIRLNYFKSQSFDFEVIRCKCPVCPDLYIATILQFFRGVLESLAWRPFASTGYADGWKLKETIGCYQLSESYVHAITNILNKAIVGEDDIFDVFYILNSSSLNKQQLKKREELIERYSLKECLNIETILPNNVFVFLSNLLIR